MFRFDNSHLIVTRGSLSLKCATTPHPSRFSKAQRYRICEPSLEGYAIGMSS